MPNDFPLVHFGALHILIEYQTRLFPTSLSFRLYRNLEMYMTLENVLDKLRLTATKLIYVELSMCDMGVINLTTVVVFSTMITVDRAGGTSFVPV